MKLTPVTDPGLIEKAQQQFEEAMTKGSEVLPRTIGHLGDSYSPGGMR